LVQKPLQMTQSGQFLAIVSVVVLVGSWLDPLPGSLTRATGCEHWLALKDLF